jgi:alkylhydroperoxidase family enzyme
MRLAPIERPKGLKLRIAYWLMRRKFGKVITPVKVVYARAPKALDLGQAMSKFLMSPFRIEKELVFLIESYTAGLNKCGFCIDIGHALAMNVAPEIMEKLYAVVDFRTDPRFTARERAALNYIDAITRDKHVNDDTFAALREHFTGEEIVEITLINAVENYYNLVNIPLEIESDGLCAFVSQSKRDKMAARA